jgi:hypothetical protein
VANELKTRYPAGATLYAHVVRADGQVWNGSAFEAPAAANWATYAVTVTEQGTTGYYYGTMPAVAAGLYDVFFLLRAGGSPATTDALVGQAGLNWNGSADSAAVADASGRVDVGKVAGTAQTARDLGANLDAAVSSRAATGAAMTLTAGERDAVAAALLDLANGVESGKTLRQALRLIAAALAGKRSNSGTATEQFDAIGAPGTARIVGNLNSSGDGVPTLTP